MVHGKGENDSPPLVWAFQLSANEGSEQRVVHGEAGTRGVGGEGWKGNGEKKLSAFRK